MEGARPATAEELPRCAELLAAALQEATPRAPGTGWLRSSGLLATLLPVTLLPAVEPGVREGGHPAGTTAPRGHPPDVDGLARWAVGEDHTLLAGLFDDVVVGVAAGRVDPGRIHLDRIDLDRIDPGRIGPGRIGLDRVGTVEACYVEPEARGVGVGTALLTALLEWFTARRCIAVDALALPGDRSTKQLLESAGFKTRLLVLRRPLR
ncbi:MAG TPA: GNAT family N-acetyltransferase [Acidimicrobiales bacterium]|nr:GNAT family N-acetyltransferase [Acidimicrobiales bacterium]